MNDPNSIPYEPSYTVDELLQGRAHQPRGSLCHVEARPWASFLSERKMPTHYA
jgi:hypothetical protein